MALTCTLSLEPGEAFFSLAIRLCRIREIPFRRIAGSATDFDRTAIRDFPIVVSALASEMEVCAKYFDAILAKHSALLYFGTTIPDLHYAQEMRSATRKPGALLRLSAGSIWSHLRLCPACTTEQLHQTGFSWWRRDHQLPLASVCLVHGCALHHDRLGRQMLRLPHEVIPQRTNGAVHARSPAAFELALCRWEQYLATAHSYTFLKTKYELAHASLSELTTCHFEKGEIACTRIYQLLLRLERAGVAEPVQDWARIELAVKKLLRDGVDYADPVAVLLFIVSQHHPGLPDATRDCAA